MFAGFIVRIDFNAIRRNITAEEFKRKAICAISVKPKNAAAVPLNAVNQRQWCNINTVFMPTVIFGQQVPLYTVIFVKVVSDY
jgi:hypothetical protein